MANFIAVAALIGAVVFGLMGWSLLGEGGYMKLLGVLLLPASIGLLLIGLRALGEGRHPGIARAAKWAFWLLIAGAALLSLSERIAGGGVP